MAAEEIIDLQVTDLLRQQISAQANSARAIAANNAELTKQVESLKNEIKRNELDFELKVKGYKEQVSQLEVTKNNKEVELERLKESRDRYKSDASLNQRAIEQRNSELENIQLRLRDEQKVTDSLRTDLRMAQEKNYQQ
jgi:cellobiose phosphorylase